MTRVARGVMCGETRSTVVTSISVKHVTIWCKIANMECAIYALIDPRTDHVRYVGKTARGLHVRLKDYFYLGRRVVNEPKQRRSPVAQWCGELMRLNLSPTIALVESCSIVEWETREKWWIADFRSYCDDLLNVSDGGTDGYHAVAANEARKRDPEAQAQTLRDTVAKLKAKGYFQSSEFLERARRNAIASHAKRSRGTTQAECSCGKHANITYIKRHHVKRFGHEVVATWVNL